jgi:hypothetical protein
MPRHQTKPARRLPRLRRIVRALGLGSMAPSVDNAGKRLPRTRAALLRSLAMQRA